ncbi:MAG TPA: GNAT family N-acetyltransferase [Ktedonobacteraceae bacterium]
MITTKHSHIVIDIISSSEQRKAAKRWQILEQEINDKGLTNSWKWIEAWLKHYGHIPHKFIFGVRDGQTIGAALVTQPLKKFKSVIPILSLHLGTNGESLEEKTCVEYNRLLVAPENLSAFSIELLRNLQQLRWSQLVLHGFVPEHAEALIAASTYLGLTFSEQNKEACPTFKFSEAVGSPDVISALKHNKKRIRSSIDKMNAQAPLKSEWAETIEQAQDILSELIELHTRKWGNTQTPSSFQSDRVKRYHKELIDAFFPEALMVFRVKLGEQTLGCLFGFVEDNHVLGYKGGINLSPDMKKFTPGLITHILCMEECRKRGYNEYNFLAGESPYKAQLSNTENFLIWATAERGLVMNAIGTTRKIKRIINN